MTLILDWLWLSLPHKKSSVAFQLIEAFGSFRRNVLVRQAESEKDKPIDITPKDFAVRTVAQEYGGGAFSISGDSVIFSNYKDQRLYKQSTSSEGHHFEVCSFPLISQMAPIVCI
ncbi:UNVERIFIED_CONTAM: hypothetical protein Sradi_3763900 [Sesamum radiatum]|uniref:Uncharacterized protein n=1 Tax=Sesamum radiatum TaxID=300843 RepID=A0AAW2PZ11_SESRA